MVEPENRELRKQLAAAYGGQQAVSTRMQSIARQVEALAAVELGRSYGPEKGQISLPVALLKEFDRQHPNDPAVQILLKEWTNAAEDCNSGAWGSALNVLMARAVSLGAEESLGQS